MAVFLALVTAARAQTPLCPLTTRLFASPKASVKAGHRITLTIKVSKDQKKAALGHGGVAVNVPPELCVLATKPGGRNVQIMPESGNVFWSSVNFNKTAAATFKLKAHVPSHFNASTATFSAHAYIPAAGCASAAAPVQVSRGCGCGWEGRCEGSCAGLTRGNEWMSGRHAA
jgi:hypothetical protein